MFQFRLNLGRTVSSQNDIVRRLYGMAWLRRWVGQASTTKFFKTINKNYLLTLVKTFGK